MYGASPDYLLRCLQVQQLAAARVVLGYHSYWWSTSKILNSVGCLSVKQLHAYSVINLAHKVIKTGVPRSLSLDWIQLQLQHKARSPRTDSVCRKHLWQRTNINYRQNISLPSKCTIQPDPHIFQNITTQQHEEDAEEGGS